VVRDSRELAARPAWGTSIYEVELDSRFPLSRQTLPVMLQFGTLYRLKVWYYVRETRASQSCYRFLSTITARFACGPHICG
jgi:hypothetical protein